MTVIVVSDYCKCSAAVMWCVSIVIHYHRSPPRRALYPATGSGECCKLSQWGLGCCPAAKAFLEYFYHRKHVWRQRLWFFSSDQRRRLAWLDPPTPLHFFIRFHLFPWCNRNRIRVGGHAVYSFSATPLLPRCMQCRRGLAMRILSVCLSVCPSVCHTRVLWRNGRKICPDLYTIRKII